METSEFPETSPAETEPNGADPDWRAEATKLKQELAKAKDINRQVQPYAQLGWALQNAKGSAKIIEKLSKGEELTDAQIAAVEKSGVAEGLTKAEVVALLEENRKLTAQEVGQRIWTAQNAQKVTERMHQRLAKDLPGYENIYDTPEFSRRWNLVHQQINDGHLEIPADIEPFDFIARHVYDWIAFDNPEIGKLKPAKKSEGERKGQLLRTSPKSEAAPEEGNRELAEAIRERVPPGGKSKVGLSLQELRRS